MLKQEAKKKQQKRRARPKSAAARSNDSARRTPRGPAASASLHGSSSMPEKKGSKPTAVNEWAMLYKFQNEQASIKEKESRKKRAEERAKWRKELLDAVNHKRSVKERSRKNDLKYKTINTK